MKILILTLIAVAKAGIIKEKCDGVQIRNIYHEKEVLKDNLNSPYQLALDFDTKILFFSLTETNGKDTFTSAYINLKTNEFGTIPGIKGGFASAIDAKKHIAYLGGNDGIYTFDFDTKVANYVSDAGEQNIWQMFYKDRLYYTDYPTETAYYYEDGESKRVEELKDTNVMVLALDNDKNIFFSNSSGLFVFKRENEEVVDIGEYTVNGFAADISGNLYFSTPSALYSINGKQVVTLLELEGIYGVVIDGENNIIYADSDKIYKLSPSKKVCDGNNKE